VLVVTPRRCGSVGSCDVAAAPDHIHLFDVSTQAPSEAVRRERSIAGIDAWHHSDGRAAFDLAGREIVWRHTLSFSRPGWRNRTWRPWAANGDTVATLAHRTSICECYIGVTGRTDRLVDAGGEAGAPGDPWSDGHGRAGQSAGKLASVGKCSRSWNCAQYMQSGHASRLLQERTARLPAAALRQGTDLPSHDRRVIRMPPTLPHLFLSVHKLTTTAS
jgi:hypothetical protein